MQLKELHQYIARRGWTLHDEYIDEISGAKDSRPGLLAMRGAAQRKQFDVLLVWAIDRLGRDLAQLVILLDDLRALDIAFVSYTQPIDVTIPSGRFSFHMLAALAQYEREQIKMRVKAGIAQRIARGDDFGRPKAEIDITEAQDRLEAGETLTAIARDMGVHRSTLKRRLDA